MDFSLNDIQSMLADSVQRFIDNDYDFETRQKIAAGDTGYSEDVWRTFAELGWTAAPFDEADGGLGGGPVETMVLMREFGRGLVLEPYLANVVLAGGVLKRIASESQKERWLRPIIAGELQAALAFAEPHARYDIADVRTTARRDDGGWVIDGQKCVVPNGGNAALLIVPARTAARRSGSGGIGLFALPADAPGMTRRAYPTVDGHRAADVTLAGVRVADDALIGTAGDGFECLSATIADATLAVAAEAVGIMQALLSRTVEYSKNRIQFGVPIGSFQALQHRMVDMLTASEQAQSLLLWATMTAAGGHADAERAVSAVKYYVGTAGRRLGEEAVQLHGGMGVTFELDVAHYFKRLIAIGILFGNADWHLDRLA